MTDTVPEKTTVSITVDGRPVEARPGELLIAAAERAGTYIPRFCYHPRMSPVGMCRMCLVEVDGPRGPALQVSCMVPVAEGMVVRTETPTVKKAQDGVLEFLLINHPLDCPVCDAGGECPLQDQTLAFGPGESRFVEEKRHYAKPIPLNELVLLDRERCVLCDRCTRFAREVAGDPLISFVERGNQTQVLTFPDEPFSSYFSGNTVQICPVGALTSTPYRFKARPWDLEQQESTCTTCAVGCRVTVQSSRNQVARYQGVDADAVNWGWMCDKGRYDYEALNSPDRLGGPLRRGADGELAPTTWADALAATAAAISGARADGGPSSVAVLGGARGSNEDAYAWAKLAKAVIGTDNVDAQLGDGLDPALVLGLPTATIDEACAAGAVLLLGPDLKEELPVLHLRLKQAADQRRTRLVELSPMATGMSPLASVSLRTVPGQAAELVRAVCAGDASLAPTSGADQIEVARARELLGAGPLVVVLGRSSLGESPSFTADAAAAVLEAFPDARFLVALRRGNVRGALDMGLAPGVLPGRVGLGQAGAELRQAWDGVPAAAGLDAAGILTAAAEGRIGCLVLLGADPLADFPDQDLARRGLAGAGTVVAVDSFLTASSSQADVVLPAAGYAEKAGTTTNLEGRISPLARQVTAPGTARPDWMIAAELALHLEADLGFASLEEIQDEIGRVAPSHQGFSAATADIRTLREGVVVPLPTARPVAPEIAPQARPSTPALADAYSLRLITSRTLYDAGVGTVHSEHLAGLARGASIHLSAYDFDRLGVAEGTPVRVSSPRGHVVLDVHRAAGLPRGSAWVPFNQPAVAASTLVDVAEPLTVVRVDTL